MTGPYSTTARNKAYAKAMSPDGRSSPNRGASPHSKGSPFDGQEWVPVETVKKERRRVAKLLNYISDIRDDLGHINVRLGMAGWKPDSIKNALDRSLGYCEEALAEADE